MKISTRIGHNVGEITITSGHATIVEDIENGGKVDIKYIDMLLNAAIDFSRFNDTPYIDFVKSIYDKYLSDYEKEQFQELINRKP